MLDALTNILMVARSLNQDTAVKAFDNESTTNMVVEMNTEEQLFELGQDESGALLENIGGDYATKTKLYKRQQGQPIDRVTLKDTGEFYRSFRAEVQYNGDIIITANTIKEGEDLQQRWGKGILGLNKQSKEKLQNEIRDDIIREVRQIL